jgi:ParB family chromosome partitioning protein
MYIDDIKTASPFRDLFPVRKRVLDDIIWDMRKNGYDNSQSLVLWKDHGNVVIDGHTRLSAAKKANIYQIPVILKAFSDEEEALKYAIACQKNRRNLSDSELVACVVELDKRKDRISCLKQNLTVAPDGATGRTSQKTADLLGISARKVERIRSIMDNAPDEIKRMVKTGRMTVNSAYNRTVGAGQPFEITRKVLDDFCTLTIKRFDREQLRYITDVLNKELSKKEDLNESA